MRQTLTCPLVGLAWAPRVAERASRVRSRAAGQRNRSNTDYGLGRPARDALLLQTASISQISYLYPQTDNAALLGLDLGTIPGPPAP